MMEVFSQRHPAWPMQRTMQATIKTGLRIGQAISICAGEKSGKSTMALDVARRWADKGKRVVWVDITLEAAEERLISYVNPLVTAASPRTIMKEIDFDTTLFILDRAEFYPDDSYLKKLRKQTNKVVTLQQEGPILHDSLCFTASTLDCNPSMTSEYLIYNLKLDCEKTIRDFGLQWNKARPLFSILKEHGINQ